MDWFDRILGEKVVRAVGCLPKTKPAAWWLWGCGGVGAELGAELPDPPRPR